MSDQESEFTPKKSENKENRAKSEHKSSKGEKKSEKSVAKEEKIKVEKPAKKEKPAKVTQKQPKKKKDSKPKEADTNDLKQLVFSYMSKQNRPYNALNIFDNLHAKHKKVLIETVLSELAEQRRLSCKEFGKNKVYFLNQSNLDISKEKVDQLARSYNELRSNEVQLASEYKVRLEELRRILVRSTFTEISEEIEITKACIDQLEQKKEKLTNLDAEKIDEEEVEKIEKQEKTFRKELNKRRRLTKDSLKLWSQILQKKVIQVAELMGVEL